MLNIKNNQFWIFDLDDTLYNEIDFLKSGYRFISKSLEPYLKFNIYEEMILYYYQNKSTFDIIKDKYEFPFSISDIVKMYRNHYPILYLPEESKKILNFLKSKKIKMGLITDGRSISQRNKIKSLDISKYFDKIIISEEVGHSKPSLNIFRKFNNTSYDYVYVADNTKKDFITPNKIGWKTICLIDNGKNIHKQDFTLSKEFLPQYKIISFEDIIKNDNKK